jgi:hypothetical protein
MEGVHRQSKDNQVGFNNNRPIEVGNSRQIKLMCLKQVVSRVTT